MVLNDYHPTWVTTILIHIVNKRIFIFNINPVYHRNFTILVLLQIETLKNLFGHETNMINIWLIFEKANLLKVYFTLRCSCL